MNINEKEYFLKYFYLIDIERLIDSIVNTDIYTNYCNNPNEVCSDFFHILFSKILDFSSEHTSFIYFPDMFNYSGKDRNASVDNGLSHLMMIVLRNHCILHGFLTSLESSEDFQPIKLSGKNDTQNKNGVFSSNIENNENESTISQIYSINKKRFNKNPLNYTYKIMCRYATGYDNGFLVVPSYAANWFCFLFNEPLVYTFDKNIASYTQTSSRYPLIKHYDELYERCLHWISQNRLSAEDTLLFTQAMESFYGFSFFRSAAKLLNKVHSSPSNFDNLTLKDLEGETLIFNIQQAAQLPITYNRHLFIEYGIHAILSSRHLKDLVTPTRERSVFSAIPTEPSSKNQLILNGLSLMENYFQNLKYIAIPLLQDLWEVVVYKLNNEYLKAQNLHIQLNTYRSYIRKNYHLLTNDYTGMSSEQLAKTTDQNIYDAKSILGVPDSYSSCNYYKTLSTKYERESFEHLLKGYFILERFDKAQYSCSNPLFDSLQPKSEFSAMQYAFYKNHRENITSLCKKLPPLYIHSQKKE